MLYARAGSRIDGDANNATPHACYMQWPAIPIVVFGRAAEAPAIPAAALPTSYEMIQYAMGLADRRQDVLAHSTEVCIPRLTSLACGSMVWQDTFGPSSPIYHLATLHCLPPGLQLHVSSAAKVPSGAHS